MKFHSIGDSLKFRIAQLRLILYIRSIYHLFKRTKLNRILFQKFNFSTGWSFVQYFCNPGLKRLFISNPSIHQAHNK